MMTQKPILYLVDDDAAIRQSLAMLLLSRGLAGNLGSFESGEAFLEGAELHRCGCVILDMRMGGISGLQVLDELKKRDSWLVVLFLSGHGDIQAAIAATQNGAFDWLEKPCEERRLMDKVGAALAWAAEVGEARQRWATLTDREAEVARLLATTGGTSKQIARQLVPPTGNRVVDTHRERIYAKLDVSNPSELLQFLQRFRI
jgi:two-component system, LuxR family, response regulator TtrR